VWNPLLARKFPSFFPPEPPSPQEFYFDVPEFSFASLEITRNMLMRHIYLRREASWRRMLIQQPPVSGVIFLSILHGSIDHRFDVQRLSCEDLANANGGENFNNGGDNFNNVGIRMNMFYDLLMSEAAVFTDWELTRLRVLWWGERPRIHEKDMMDIVLRAAAPEPDVLIYRSHYDPVVFDTLDESESLKTLTRPEQILPEAKEATEIKESISYPYQDWGTNGNGYGPQYLGIDVVRRGPLTKFL
jgi:hypothetical protein